MTTASEPAARLLGRSGRQTLLAVHVAINAVLLGALVAVLVLELTRRGPFAAAFDRAVLELHEWLITPCCLLVLGTGMLFSLFTPWGYAKFRWIVAKWFVLFAVAVIDLWLLSPAVASSSAISDAEGRAALLNPEYQEAARWVLGSAALLLLLLFFAIAISVFKPWGRTALRFSPRRRVVLAGSAAVVVLGLAIGVPQTLMLRSIRRTEIAPADLSVVADGRWVGSVERMGARFEVEVEIADHRLVRAEARQMPSGFYPALAGKILPRMVRENRVDVDVISGATTSSRLIQLAVLDALAGRRRVD
ncbi:MAG: DUF2269 family protein [Deltaproteobacteria bacterium]|nr:DUF2269 family protein [Deltaproteobacteria bacterium]